MTSCTPTATADPALKDPNPDDTADASKFLQTATRKQQGLESSPIQNTPEVRVATNPDGEDMIMIQRTYNFAGKVHVEEKLVPRDSAEAKLWLQTQSDGKRRPQPADLNITKPLRPPKKARRSIFEPITEPLPQRTDLRFGVSNISRTGTSIGVSGGMTAKKLNTVEKSKMDWAGFVDKEGIKDELETAGKAKGAYLDHREFLARVEEKREEEARRARLKAL
jgi:Bucentaur or craniofacial development